MSYIIKIMSSGDKYRHKSKFILSGSSPKKSQIVMSQSLLTFISHRSDFHDFIPLFSFIILSFSVQNVFVYSKATFDPGLISRYFVRYLVLGVWTGLVDCECNLCGVLFQVCVHVLSTIRAKKRWFVSSYVILCGVSLLHLCFLIRFEKSCELSIIRSLLLIKLIKSKLEGGRNNNELSNILKEKGSCRKKGRRFNTCKDTTEEDSGEEW